MKILRRVLLVAAFAALPVTTQASSKPAPLPTTTPGSEAILLGNDSVRKELGLTSLQKAVLNDIRTEYRETARKIIANAGTTPASKQAAKNRLDAATRDFNHRAVRVLNDEQLARFRQVERQILGAYVLLDARVQQQLALTAQQREKLAYVYSRLEKSANAINQKYEAGKISYYQRVIELRDNRIDRSDDMLERLTKEQRTKLRVMEGDKFNG